MWPKSQDKNLDVLRTKRAFESSFHHKKQFSSFLNAFSCQKCLRPESVPLMTNASAMKLDFSLDNETSNEYCN